MGKNNKIEAYQKTAKQKMADQKAPDQKILDHRMPGQKNLNQRAGTANPKKKRTLSFWEKYLAEEIGIELKACLYFFCILFYYTMYRLLGGSLDANIIHMAEMIFLTYGMGYAQVYLMNGFDEGDDLGVREIGLMILCSLVYTGVSYWGGWFNRNAGVTVGFMCYMVLAYICAFFVYKIKRTVDAKILNEELKTFQERGAERQPEREADDGTCDRDL